ncbi:MAG: response regulator transcription factor [Terriglobia bacterium]
MYKILVLYDENNASTIIGNMMEQEGLIPIWATNLETGLARARSQSPQLLILDLPIPGTGGMEFCAELRSSKIRIPIIVLSPTDDEIERILTLEMGADDYMVKPFNPRELLARMRAVLRRTVLGREPRIRFGEVEIEPERRVIRCRDKEVKVTPCEYNLLLYFVQNPDRALTRDAILNSVWGYEAYLNTRTVDAHIVKLRSKFEPDPAVPKHFLTVHGVGYRFLM